MEVSPDQLELIDKVAKKNGFEKYELDIEPGSRKGDNYMGIITRVKIKDENQEINLILKAATTNEALRNVQPTRSVFLREIYMYQNVFKEFEAFEEEYNIPDRFQACAKFYDKCDKDKCESLILEDMKYKNFQMVNKQNTMNCHHIKAVLKEYAKFHSISLAMNYKQPERFRALTKDLIHPFEQHFKDSPLTGAEFTTAILSNAFKAVEGDRIATEALKKYQSYVETHLLWSCEPEDRLVITHGDCWCNNLLFKYKDEQKTTPSGVCIIDWQLSQFGSPGLDIAYLLFVNAPKDILKDYKNYLNFYYNIVCGNLKAFGCEPDVIFPFKILEGQFNKQTKKVLWLCVMLMRVMLCESEEIPDWEQDVNSSKSVHDMINFGLNNAEKYYERLTILINFMIKNNLF